MRYVLSSVRLDLAPPGSDAPAPTEGPPTSGKTDVDVTSLGIVGQTLTVQIPAQNPAVNNLMGDLRAYVMPVTDQAPADAIGYLASQYPFVALDPTPYQANGGNAQLNLPDATVPSAVQLVLGFLT
jgi:hypothetical protein